ncbi:MAG TPA: Spy/CpxP family protein refolding chaperone [Burkholderiales bacterium]|nr:Spy/CpxP family protein refolding chaperone [Burkholderiales bacterium]
MIRRHLTQFLLASSCALGLGPIAANEAFGQSVRGPMGEGMMHEGMHDGAMGGGPMTHMRGLNLTEAQRDQIFKIHYEQMPAMREQMKQVEKARNDLRQIALADKFDEARARQAADAQAKAIAAMAVMRAQAMNRVRQVLTPEQRQKMDQWREHHRRG